MTRQLDPMGFPLHHPGEPMYMHITHEEYDRIMKENARMKEALKRHGITLLDKEMK